MTYNVSGGTLSLYTISLRVESTSAFYQLYCVSCCNIIMMMMMMNCWFSVLLAQLSELFT